MQAPRRKLITTRDVATLLGLSSRSLEGYRLRGGGPPFYRLGKRTVRYDEDEVFEWATRERRASTSDTTGEPLRSAAMRALNLSAASRLVSSNKNA